MVLVALALISLAVRSYLRTPLHDYRRAGSDKDGPDTGPAAQSGDA